MHDRPHVGLLPALTADDAAVIAEIEAYRERLRRFLARPRRWRGQLRRNLRARAMRGSNSIEGYDVSLDDAIAILENDDEAIDADQKDSARGNGLSERNDLRSAVG